MFIMETPIVELEGITKHYIMGTTIIKALDGISLQINKGDFATVIGPSGSGKSTLLHVIGLITQQTTGVIRLMGNDISTVKESQRYVYRRDIANIFQDFNLINSFTALENVSIALAAKGQLNNKQSKERARKLLKQVGLGDRMDHYPGKLSGGEKQRVAVARAIAVDPVIMLADEPTGNLDQATGREILDMLFDLNKEKHQTILLVTHDLSIASRIGNIITMVDGKITSQENEFPLQGEDAVS